MLMRDMAVLTAAPDAGNRVFDFGHFLVGDFGDFRTDRLFARETEIWGDIRIFNDCLSIALAASISATTAISFWQRLQDLLDKRIGFDFEAVCGDSESDSEEKSDTSEQGQTIKGDIYKFHIHDLYIC